MNGKKKSSEYLLYNMMRLKIYYENDLNKENTELDDYIEDLDKRIKKNLEINIEQVENEVKSFWKDLIFKAKKGLLNTIKNRGTKGSEFSKIILKLEKIKDDVNYEDYDIEKLRTLYEEDLKSLRNQAKEKIDIEKNIKKHRYQDLFIGFIVGIVASILSWIIITILV